MTLRILCERTPLTHSSKRSSASGVVKACHGRKSEIARGYLARGTGASASLPLGGAAQSVFTRLNLNLYPQSLAPSHSREQNRLDVGRRIEGSSKRRGIHLALAFFLGALLAPSCGAAPTGVALTIDSNLVVPEEVDALVVRILPVGFDEMIERIALDGSFPHSMEIELESGSASLTIVVHAMKGEGEVSTVHVQVRPVIGQVVAAKVVL